MDLKILEKPFNFTLSNLYELWYKTGPIFLLYSGNSGNENADEYSNDHGVIYIFFCKTFICILLLKHVFSTFALDVFCPVLNHIKSRHADQYIY